MGCPVDVEEGTRYKLQKKANNGFVYALYWELGFLMARIFKFFRLSPNFVSLLSLVFYILAGWAFWYGEFVWGGVAFFLGILMDCTDGKLARMTNNTSALGVWLDYNFDNLRPLLIYPPIAFALFTSTGKLYYFVFAFVAVVASLIFVIISTVWDGMDFAEQKKQEHVRSKWHVLLKQFYFYEGIEPLALIGFAAFGYVQWYLIFWACGMAGMYLLMAFYGGIVIKRKDNEVK